jgi:ABC-type uncharacterized transport system permease subunit
MGALPRTAPALGVFDVTPAVAVVMQGIILLFVADAQFLIRYQLRIISPRLARP